MSGTASSAAEINDNAPTGLGDFGHPLNETDLDNTVAESFGLPTSDVSDSSGLTVIADVTAQIVQVTLTMGLALTLAGILCCGLMMSARHFSHSARTARRAIQGHSSIQSLSERLRAVANDPQAVHQREQFVREINNAIRQFDVREKQPE